MFFFIEKTSKMSHFRIKTSILFIVVWCTPVLKNLVKKKVYNSTGDDN